MKCTILPLLALFFIILPLHSQVTHENPILNDRFYVDVGMYFPTRGVEVGANGSSPNLPIDFDETFGLDDNLNTLYFRFKWRFSKRWKVEFEYFGVNNGNRVTLDRDISFQDITIEQGTTARGGVEFDLYRVFFGRRFINREKHVLGGGLGFHGMQVGAFVEGEVRTSEGDLSFERRRVSMLVPLPNIGGWYSFAPSRKWLFNAQVDWFYITISDYSGGLWNIAPGVNYQIIDNLGVGLDYRFFYLSARMDASDWNGKFSMDFSGPIISIYANF